MNPFLRFVEDIVTGIHSADELVAHGSTSPLESSSKVVLFSPHPDDECVTGLLPLRLMRETGRQIINVPVTFGSNLKRREGRALELAKACSFLGFHLHKREGGLEPLEINDVCGILKELEPEIVFMPHSTDSNSSHVATNHLVMEGLARLGSRFSCTLVETEFWSAMTHPNLMVGADVVLVADLVAATSMHTLEVKRNPFHLLLPAWMQDNLRRGSELVGGQGNACPDFSFATLYRMRRWHKGRFDEGIDKGTIIPPGANLLREVFDGSHHQG